MWNLAPRKPTLLTLYVPKRHGYYTIPTQFFQLLSLRPMVPCPFVQFDFMDLPAASLGIAIVNTVFKVGATILLMPFSRLLVKIVTLQYHLLGGLG